MSGQAKVVCASPRSTEFFLQQKIAKRQHKDDWKLGARDRIVRTRVAIGVCFLCHRTAFIFSLGHYQELPAGTSFVCLKPSIRSARERRLTPCRVLLDRLRVFGFWLAQICRCEVFDVISTQIFVDPHPQVVLVTTSNPSKRSISIALCGGKLSTWDVTVPLQSWRYNSG